MLGVGTAGSVGPRPPGTTTAPAPDDGDPDARERDAWTILTAVDHLGPIAFAALLARFGTGRGILAAATGPRGIEELAGTPPLDPDPDGVVRRPVPQFVAVAIVNAVHRGPILLDRVRSLGLRAVTVNEAAYPTRAARIAMPPHVLFVLGSVDAVSRARSVAVVGTRRATTAGRTTAGRIATALVAAESTVVSGLAYGIDGVAHEATVSAGGTTVAVIGGGHAVAVPGGHRRLARAILDAGGAIVSELAPDVEPTRGTFPRRNRIISGLADATVVVEAPARSGALVTASWALEQGRPCFLVPGPIDFHASAGCLAFLREFHGEARLVAGIPQLIADLGYAERAGHVGPAGLAGAALQELGRTGRDVAAAMLSGAATVDELVATTDLPVATVLASLALLEGRGLVVGVHGRYRAAGALLGERATRKPT